MNRDELKKAGVPNEIVLNIATGISIEPTKYILYTQYKKEIDELETKLKLSNERALRTYDGMAQKADKYDNLKAKLDLAVEALVEITWFRRDEFEKARKKAAAVSYTKPWSEHLDHPCYFDGHKDGAYWTCELLANEYEQKITELEIELKLSDERSLRTYDGMAQKADKYDEMKAKLDVAIEALKYYNLIHESAYHIVSGEPAKQALSIIKGEDSK